MDEKPYESPKETANGGKREPEGMSGFYWLISVVAILAALVAWDAFIVHLHHLKSSATS